MQKIVPQSVKCDNANFLLAMPKHRFQVAILILFSIIRTIYKGNFLLVNTLSNIDVIQYILLF